MDWPNVVVIMTTYFPDGEEGKQRLLHATIPTFNSWEAHLKYSAYPGGEGIHVVQADDGTSKENYVTFGWFRGYLCTSTLQKRKGVGASLNSGFRRAYEVFGPDTIVLYAVDDWALTQDFDISPWVQLLLEREEVGMVRLGPPHPNTSGVVQAYTENWQGWGLHLYRTDYAFGHRPALYHKRMIDYYGWFKEDCSALECEKDYSDRFVEKALGPNIVLALPHPWQHLESIELAYIDPKDEN